MNALPTTGELFATNQVSPQTERCYEYELRSFAEWVANSHRVRDTEGVTTADLMAYRQSLSNKHVLCSFNIHGGIRADTLA